MNIFKNISDGYKKIATGIAIVSFLAVIYIALIPGGTLAAIYDAQGVGISGAFVKIVEWSQYNATTASDGTYMISGVPYDNTPAGSTYTLRVSADGYGSNSSKVTLTPGDPNPAVSWTLYSSEPRYLPFLYDAGNYESNILMFNPYDFNATADFTTYNNLDGLNKTMSFEIPINTLGSKFAKQVAGGNFLGGAKVVNTRPESLVIASIRTISTNIYSIAPSFKIPSTNIQYLPFLYDAGAYDSGIQVFNPYKDPIIVNITGYNNLTGLNSTITFSIPGETYASRKPKEVVGGDFLGGIKVETSLPAIVQGNVRTLSTGTATIAPSVNKQSIQYIPFLYDAGAYDSGIQVFNPYKDPIIVNITGYNKLTGLNSTITFSIPGETYYSRKPKEVVGGDFLGSIKVETSQPALVQGNVRTLSTGTATLAPAILLTTVNTHYILFLNDTGTTFDSGVQVFNPYKVDIWANATAYNLLTGVTTSLNFTIPPEVYDSRTAQQIAGGSDFIGSVKVETSQPALVQANIRTLISGTATIEPATILQ